MTNEDYLYGFIKYPQDKDFKKRGIFAAHSLEFCISASGGSKQDAAESLAHLINETTSDGQRLSINPFHTNSKLLEDAMKYCADKNKMPSQLDDISMENGKTLKCYDLTN
tara:strand:- start:1787 stop:2116 length:330 start_codon:yes stop_codon:yes gene_type:complete